MLPFLFIGVLCIISSSLGENLHNSTEIEEDGYYPSDRWSDQFDWNLLKAFCKPEFRNVLVSPISLKLVLALLYEGSTGNTEREFQQVLRFPPEKIKVREQFLSVLNALKPSEREQYVLNLGTRIFLDSEITPKQKFQATAAASYHTDIEPTNFSHPIEASQAINSWIDKLTNGRIAKIVNPDELADTIMLVSNAIYFRGTWMHRFPKNQTRQSGFYVTPHDIVQVPFIRTSNKFYYFESNDLDAKILRLPYKGNQFSLFIVLPNAKAGLADLVKKVNLQVLKQQLYLLDYVTVDVCLPKFKFDFQAHLSEVLRGFGLNQMFQNTASFPGIARGNSSLLRKLVVSDILQKTGIEIDEEGTVVYAATEVQIGTKFGEGEVFNATHPFLFFIEEQSTGSILFVGKVENPLEITSHSRFGEVDVNNTQEATVEQNANKNPASEVQPLGINLSPNNPHKEAILSRFNYFDLELLKEISEVDGNVFISPASIKSTLALILEGAKGKSATEIGNALRIGDIDNKQIREVLQRLLFDLSDKSANTLLESKNSIFIANKRKIAQDYEKKVVNEYKALIKKLNFTKPIEAAQVINSWASEATHGLINDIINPQSLGSDTEAVIVNALYFKGKWKTAFDPKETKPRCFHSPRHNRCVDTAMMQVTDTFNYSFIKELSAHAVELPYQDDKYSMLILLPSEQSNIKILANDMPHAAFNSILGLLNPVELILTLPKFDIDYDADLVNYLRPFKITSIFTSAANLTGMIPEGGVFVNKIVQKAKIEVNEQGTRAAAATSAIVAPLMGGVLENITVDRPFLFFIYHKESKNIIFEGIFKEPIAASASVQEQLRQRALFQVHNPYQLQNGGF